jgi:hypothetical protein
MRLSVSSAAAFILNSISALALASPPPVAAERPRGGATSKPQGTASRHRFERGRAALRIPFEPGRNLIYLKARVNNSRPLWFILDTGASASIIDGLVANLAEVRAGGQTSDTGRTKSALRRPRGTTALMPSVGVPAAP